MICCCETSVSGGRADVRLSEATWWIESWSCRGYRLTLINMEITKGTLPLVLLLLFTGECSSERITKCWGDWYSGQFANPPRLECTYPAVISVVGGFYGVSQCTTGTCCPAEGDCTILMTNDDLDIQNIRNQCNAKQECPGDLRAQRKGNINCGSGSLQLSNYVIIYFDCLTDGSTPSPTPGLSTASSTTPPLTTITSSPTAISGGSTSPTSTPPTGSTSPNNSTTPPTPPRTGLSAGAIVGIVFGVIFGILLILFIIFAILVRRKNPNWPQTHNWQEPFKDYKSYIPDRVTSVVNRITRRQDEHPKQQYAPEVTVSDTSKNYQDANMLPGNYQGNSHLPAPHAQQTNPSYQDATLHAVSTGDRPDSGLPVGVQIVRTPQDAIDESARVPTGDGFEDEPMYETIDDFTRGGSVYSVDSFDSIPMEDNDMYEQGASQKVSPNKMKINDAIYYGALEGNKESNLRAENSIYDKSSERGSVIPASPKVGRMTNVGVGKPQDDKPSSNLPAPSSPKPGYKTIPPKSGLKPGQGSPKPGAKKPAPTSPKPNRGAPGRVAGSGIPPTGGGDEVYENTDFEPEQDTYYNAGDVPAEGRYSRLDPATALRASTGEAYQALGSSSC